MSANASPENRDKPCPPPQDVQAPPRRFAMPLGAADTHTHVIGASDYVGNRGYTPTPASAEQYIAVLDAVGLTFGVLVQVSVHGTDNSLMLNVLRRYRDRLRGVAVAPHDLPEAVWRELAEAGVTGLRLNTVSRSGMGVEHLDTYEAVCRELGWHLQFISDPRELARLAPRLARLRVPAVLDHMGHFSLSDDDAEASMRLVRQLVADGAWVKLSGAYRMSRQLDSYADVAPFARRLIEAGPDRCIWGSDWPHVNHWDRMPGMGELLDLLADWAPDDASRTRILVDNPKALYGFPTP